MDIPLPITESKDSSIPAEGMLPLAEPQNSPHDLFIDVLGAKFSISADADPAYLDNVLAQYQIAVENTQGISEMKDPLKVAILTGFLLCDEINKIKLQIQEEQAKTDAEMNRIMGNILARIEKVFHGKNL